VRLNLFK